MWKGGSITTPSPTAPEEIAEEGLAVSGLIFGRGVELAGEAAGAAAHGGELGIAGEVEIATQHAGFHGGRIDR